MINVKAKSNKIMKANYINISRNIKESVIEFCIDKKRKTRISAKRQQEVDIHNKKVMKNLFSK